MRTSYPEAPVFARDLLKDRVIVVTGGGSGLGAEMAKRFSELGARIAVLGRRKEKLDAVISQLGSGLAISCDVRDAKAVQEAADRVASEMGRVDALVNNAAGNFLAPAEDISPNGFKAVVDIVLNGTFHCTTSFGRKMIEQKRGAIVNIVTTYAWTGSAFVLPSACAKAGVLVLTRSLAVEWAAYGVRVNAIAPGPVPTEGAFSRLMPDPSFEEQARNRVPLKRFGTPREIADAAAFLLSDGAGYVTGDCLVVDGGERLKNGGEFSYVTDYDRDNVKQMFRAMRGKEKQRPLPHISEDVADAGKERDRRDPLAPLPVRLRRHRIARERVEADGEMIEVGVVVEADAGAQMRRDHPIRDRTVEMRERSGREDPDAPQHLR